MANYDSSHKSNYSSLSSNDDNQSHFSLYLLLIIASILAFVDKNNIIDLKNLRQISSSLTLPLQNLVSYPVSGIKSLPDQFSQIINLKDKNSQLSLEIERLQKIEIELQRFKRENTDLREILKLPSLTNQETELDYRQARTARVISYQSTDFNFAYTINAGYEQGIGKNFIAVNQNGLIGRVISVFDNYSVVLLIHDYNSRIPVETITSGELAVLIGDDSNYTRLEFIKSNSKIIDNEKVVTSGHGGLFPAGITVGFVEMNDQEIKVRPVNNFYSIGWMRLYPAKKLDLGDDQ